MKQFWFFLPDLETCKSMFMRGELGFYGKMNIKKYILPLEIKLTVVNACVQHRETLVCFNSTVSYVIKMQYIRFCRATR